MERRRTRSIRLALSLALIAAVAGAAATVAHALAFDDGTPCRDTQPVFVCPQGTVGTPYSIQMIGRAGCTPYSFGNNIGSLPPGLSLSSGGRISGTPTASGTWNFWLQLFSNCPADPPAEREFTLTVNPGLRITTNDLPQNATIGAPYTATLDAQVVTNLNPLTGSAPASGSVTWSVVPGFGTGLPPGLVLANGVITGTPNAEGAFQFRIQAALDPTRTHVQTYSLTVRQPLAIAAAMPLAASPAPTLWEVSVPFSAKLTPSGGSGTYTYTLAAGTLPTGLAVAADGTVSGRPTSPGIFRATIRLADSEGRTLDYAANFAVAPKLAITTAALRPGKVGRNYRAQLKTTGGISPKSWRVVSGPLPKGVRLDRKLGVLLGVPKKPGSYRVRFEAKDGLKVVAQKTLRIVVRP